MSITGIPELLDGYRKMGPLRFWLMMVALLAWIGVGAWLSISLDWPDRYGFHCNGRGCLFEDLWYSPRLIDADHRSLKEVGLFAFYWVMVAIPLAALLWRLLKKRPRLTIFESTPKE